MFVAEGHMKVCMLVCVILCYKLVHHGGQGLLFMNIILCAVFDCGFGLLVG